MPTVRAIVAESAKQDYRFESLVLGIVKSPQFQMKRLPSDRPAPALRTAAATP